MRDSVRDSHSRSRALKRSAARVSLAALLALLALAAWLLPLTPARAASLSRQDANGAVTIKISNPRPDGSGLAQGPVGANIYAEGAVSAGDAVSLGYAPTSVGCQTGLVQFADADVSALIVNPNGDFTVQISWPADANTQDAQYYLCAQDTTTNTIGQSTTKFQVDNSSAPSISVTAIANPNAPTPNATAAATVEPTATAQSGYGYSSGYFQVSGQNFTPGGQKIYFFLTPQQAFTSNEYDPAGRLKVVSGSANSDSSGSFQVIVQLPAGETGPLAVVATSADGSQGAVLPSLVAQENITLQAPPATPTPGPTATAAPKSTPGNTHKTSKPPVGVWKMSGLIGLGALSVIFFIVGVAFLVSAAGMPKP